MHLEGGQLPGAQEHAGGADLPALEAGLPQDSPDDLRHFLRAPHTTPVTGQPATACGLHALHNQ